MDFLWSLGDHLWFLIKYDWTYPTKTIYDVTIIFKPMIEWTKEESIESKWNRKGLYAIILAVTINKYQIIQTFTIFKQAWDILEITSESTFTVKRSRIFKLNRDFKLCIMEEYEMFNKVHTYFSIIMNYTYNIKRPISKEKQIEKFIISLPNHFHANATIIESMCKLGEVSVKQLVSDLQVFKHYHLLLKHGQIDVEKGKKISLKTIKSSVPNRDVNTTIVNDEISHPDKEKYGKKGKRATTQSLLCQSPSSSAV